MGFGFFWTAFESGERSSNAGGLILWPVKMLLPLLVFIFPCTFAVLLFPIVGRMLMEGWLK